MNLNKSKSYFDIQNEYDFKNHLNGTYINNYNLQNKKIVPLQKGEKIILRARERSGTIREQNLNIYEKSKNIFNKNEENKNSGNNNNQKLNVERSPKKKQTTLLKDLSMSNTGELKKKTKKKI